MPNPTPSRTVAVIGSGIAGLTAAWRLQQQGVKVRVFEREPHPGGRMATIDHDGFRIELGATILLKSYTGMRKLIGELGISDQFTTASTLSGFLRDGTVHRFRADAKTDLMRTRLLSIRTKLALLRTLPTLAAQRTRLDWDTMDRNTSLDQLSASQYAQRHLTPEAFDYLCEPLVGGGIVLASPDDVNAADMFFFATKLPTPYFNSPHGVGLLTQTLAHQLPMQLNAHVTAVRPIDEGVTITWRSPEGAEHSASADAAVVATPAPQAQKLLPDLPDEDQQYLRSIPYSRTLVITLGLRRPPPETATALFLSRRAHPDLVSVALHHNKMPTRVDNGHGLITLHPRPEFTERWWNADDETITKQALAAASTLFPDITNTLLTCHISRCDPALVVRPPGGYAALRAFNTRRRTADPRIQLAGDYFGPSSTYIALRSGERAAARAFHHLQSRCVDTSQ
nr:FAD-dependent oxidoreductase [Streptomyces sp. NBC_01177]